MRRQGLLICLLVALAGCGGDDKKDAEQTVRDFVTALNTHDADRYCDDLITEEFLKKSTFSTGDADKARESCKREFKNLTGLRVKLAKVEATRVEGDKATVTAVLTRQGQRFRQKLLLEKEGGDWKLAGGAQ